MYMTPSTTARTSTVRLLPPRFAGGIGGAMSAHSSSVRSLGYRSLLRSYRARFSRLHMAAVLPAPAVSGQSQPIQMTQLVPGQTLSSTLHVSFGRWRGKSLIHLSQRSRPSLPRRLATDAESANTRRGGKDVVTASG